MILANEKIQCSIAILIFLLYLKYGNQIFRTMLKSSKINSPKGLFQLFLLLKGNYRKLWTNILQKKLKR